jgi:hypothetical protein
MMIGSTLKAKLNPTMSASARGPQFLDCFLTAAPEKNNCGNRRLQRKCRADNSQVNRFPIARKCDRYRENYDDAKDSDQVTRHGVPPRSVIVIVVGA